MTSRRSRRAAVPVSDLLGPDAPTLRLEVLAGRKGLDRTIDRSRVQRPGLALAGFTRYLSYGRVQIVGGSESAYLRTLTRVARARVVRNLMSRELSCLIVTRGLTPDAELRREADRRRVPLLATSLDSTSFIRSLSDYLDDRLARRSGVHAVMVDVLGVGVLIEGDSGIGKSECALELIDRGHRLVSDDVVELKATTQGLVGSAPARTQDLMEIRGLGIIDIKTLYGVSAVRPQQRVDLVVRLEKWNPRRTYERLGLEAESTAILGRTLPLLRLPVAPGRNVALLVEIAAKNQRLKARGHDAAHELVNRLDAEMRAQTAEDRAR